MRYFHDKEEIKGFNLIYSLKRRKKRHLIPFLSRNPGTKIKEPGTSSSFVFLHLLHNISFGR